MGVKPAVPGPRGLYTCILLFILVDLGLLGLTSNENPWFILPSLFVKKRSIDNDARSLVGGDRYVQINTKNRMRPK